MSLETDANQLDCSALRHGFWVTTAAGVQLQVTTPVRAVKLTVWRHAARLLQQPCPI